MTLTCTSAALVGYMWLSLSQVCSAAPSTVSSGTVAWERLRRAGEAGTLALRLHTDSVPLAVWLAGTLAGAFAFVGGLTPEAA